jgi:site-specific DNA recombinase
LDNLRKLASQRGWDIVGEYVDYGISGYTGDRRPEFQKLVLAVSRGQVDVVMARDYDRLTRNDVDKMNLSIASVKNKVKWQLATGELTDPGTALGALTVNMMAGVAIFESDLKRERLLAHYKDKKAKGALLPAHRPFGYNADKLTLHETEAPAAQAAYQRILEGGSIYSIVKEWNTEGPTRQKPTRGKLWTTQILRAYLLRPGNAGLIRDGQGWLEGVTAVWDPLVTIETFMAARAILTDPVRRVTPGPKQSHMLGNIALCGVCHRPLSSAAKSVTGKRNITVLKCRNPDRSQGAHVSVPVTVLDPLVTDAVVSALLFGVDAAPEHKVDLAPLEATLSDVRGRKQSVLALVAKGRVTDAEADAHLDALQEEEEAAQAALTDARGELAGASLSAPIKEFMAKGRPTFEEAAAHKKTLLKQFEELTLTQKRELVNTLLKVTVKRGRDDNRIIIEHLRAVSLNADDPSNEWIDHAPVG